MNISTVSNHTHCLQKAPIYEVNRKRPHSSLQTVVQKKAHREVGSSLIFTLNVSRHSKGHLVR